MLNLRSFLIGRYYYYAFVKESGAASGKSYLADALACAYGAPCIIYTLANSEVCVNSICFSLSGKLSSLQRKSTICKHGKPKSLNVE